MAGFGIDLERCDPELREAVFLELREAGREERTAVRLARLKGRLGG